jgi:PAS domain S-box-containing protein
VSTGKDITERKKAEEALRASVERGELIMDVTTDAVYDWDLATDRVQWNHGLRTLFGYTDADLRDHQWWLDRVHPDDVDPVEDRIRAALASGERFWTGEYRYLRADGSFAHVVDRGYVIRDDDLVPVRMLGAMVDITDRVRLAEAQTRAAVEERQRLARELHDSITQSLYSLTLLAEAGRRFAGQGDLRQAKHHLKRLGETAQQALKEMRLLVYELRPLALQKVGLAGALRQRLDAVEKRAGVQARLEVEGSLALPPPLEEGLYRLAHEALNNALKHSASASMVVRLLSDGEYVRLEVEDRGIGFDPDSAGAQGGMGLSNMRDRAERLGADLVFDSAIGQGTSVWVKVKIPGDSPVNPSPSRVAP